MPYQNSIDEYRQKIQELFEKLVKARTLVEMILLALELGKTVAVKAVEIVLEKRTQERCKWPECPQCGARIENKEQQERQIKSIIGLIHWK